MNYKTPEGKSSNKSNVTININNSEVKEFCTGGLLPSDKVPALLNNCCGFLSKKAWGDAIKLINFKYKIGDKVVREAGQNEICGEIRSVFLSLAGKIFIVVEDRFGNMYTFEESE